MNDWKGAIRAQEEEQRQWEEYDSPQHLFLIMCSAQGQLKRFKEILTELLAKPSAAAVCFFFWSDQWCCQNTFFTSTLSAFDSQAEILLKQVCQLPVHLTLNTALLTTAKWAEIFLSETQINLVSLSPCSNSTTIWEKLDLIVSLVSSSSGFFYEHY